MVRVIDIENAESFLEFFRPYGSPWRPERIQDVSLTIPTGWIFRGKRDAVWTLLPKALRPNALEHYAGSKIRCNRESNLGQRRPLFGPPHSF